MNSSTNKIAVYGGSFDPPHIGHVHAVLNITSMTDAQEIWVNPAVQNPLKPQSSDFFHRVEMVKLMLEPFAEHVMMKSIDHAIAYKGLKHTVDVIGHWLEMYPRLEVILPVGADVIHQRDKWKDFDRLEEMVELVVFKREGYPIEGYSMLPHIIDVSSTAIREALAKGGDVSHLVPAKVLAYIKEHGLYTNE